MGFSTSTCTEFVEVLASKAPVPGGGGASALVAAVGTALGNMVGSLTVGKKKYADVEDEMWELKGKCDQLQKDFLRLGFAVVHQPHPGHRIAGFQFLRHARCLHQLRHHLLQPPVHGLLDLVQVRVQFPVHHHGVEQDWPMLLQIIPAHPPVPAQGLRFLQLQVGDQVISVPRVSQVVLHV